MNSFAPFLWFYLAAIMLPLLRGHLRSVVALAAPIVSAIFLFQIETGSYGHFELFGQQLILFRVDKLSLLFGYLFHLATFIAVIYALHERDLLQQCSALAYAGSALGAVFAGDLISLFIFWELLALTSVFLVWARRTPAAYHSGMRYLIMQVGSGMLLLVGILAHIHHTGSSSFEFIGTTNPYSWIILLAFGIKAGFPFFHNWITDAYPESTATGTVFLSAFTTKVAIYALARAFPGTEALIYIGVSMAAFPIFYAVIENDLRRVLGYSMINQLGFMVCGIGIGTQLAVNGAVAHAFTDVIFKGLLFMSMGAVLHRTGRMNGSDLGGLFKSMPYTSVMCIIGAASISAFPLFSGFVSKSMIMSASMELDLVGVWLILLFASAGVFHHAGIKIPFFAFFAHDSGLRPKEAPWNMRIAMTMSASLCLLIGIWPELLYQLLPFKTDYNPYDLTHVITQTQLLFFSALAFVWLKLNGLYPPELHSTNLDVEYIYRRALPTFWNNFTNLIVKIRSQALGSAQRVGVKLFATLFKHHGPHGILAQSWPTGSMVLWVTLMLCVSLVFYYF